MSIEMYEKLLTITVWWYTMNSVCIIRLREGILLQELLIRSISKQLMPTIRRIKYYVWLSSQKQYMITLVSMHGLFIKRCFHHSTLCYSKDNVFVHFLNFVLAVYLLKFVNFIHSTSMEFSSIELKN